MSVAIKTTSVERAVPEGVPPLAAHRFTPEQYEQLAELGILTPNDRVELLEGWIVDKMTQYPPHSSGVDDVMDALRAVLPAHWRLRSQMPIRTADSLPEPDVVVVRGPKDRYRQRHPIPSDIALIIEVADTTLDEDRVRKGRIYARARIPVYWIVNLVDNIVEVYMQPKAGKSPSYRQHQDFGRDDALPLIIDGKEIARIPASELLPA